MISNFAPSLSALPSFERAASTGVKMFGRIRRASERARWESIFVSLDPPPVMAELVLAVEVYKSSFRQKLRLSLENHRKRALGSSELLIEMMRFDDVCSWYGSLTNIFPPILAPDGFSYLSSPPSITPQQQRLHPPRQQPVEALEASPIGGALFRVV